MILSADTQAILLLTSPLLVGPGTEPSEPLTPRDYKRLVQHLHQRKLRPAHLISPDGEAVLRTCPADLEADRLRRLLGRGFQLSQAFERWQARAIWVVSRADAAYPRRLKEQLGESAPAVIYGCGDKALLERGGLAVVGSRNANFDLIDYTRSVGHLAARAGVTVVSGGAQGVDQAAMRGGLEAGGHVVGVLPDRLEEASMNREHRNWLLEGQLVLCSSSDPGAKSSRGVFVGRAMDRNKLVYALADAALVVESALEDGGTWKGAVEQLDRLKLVPVYVRAKGEPSPGLDALRRKGALPWPEPQNADSLKDVLQSRVPAARGAAQKGLALFADEGPVSPLPSVSEVPVSYDASNEVASLRDADAAREGVESEADVPVVPGDGCGASVKPLSTPSDILFSVVREQILGLLQDPKKDEEVAKALDVRREQAKAWLSRLVEEGAVEKRKRPSVRYVVKVRLG